MDEKEFRFKDTRMTPEKNEPRRPASSYPPQSRDSLADRLKALGFEASQSDDPVLVVAMLTEYLERPQPQPAPEIAEKVLFQTLIHSHDQDDSTLSRVGGFTKDLEAAEGQALRALQAPMAKEAFVVRVEAAYTKETNIKKAI